MGFKGCGPINLSVSVLTSCINYQSWIFKCVAVAAVVVVAVAVATASAANKTLIFKCLKFLRIIIIIFFFIFLLKIQKVVVI